MNLEQLGTSLTEVGLKVMPYSFAIYFPIRWLEFAWNKGYTRIVKAIWYFALGSGYVTGNVGTDVIVTYICFIEAWDHVFQHFEVARMRS